MDNTEEFRCLSLCSGYAGIELGLKRAVPALRTVAYVEVEAFACANLVVKIEANLLDAAPIWTDIKTFPAKYFRDRIHIITAGYPCQPFSCSGKRQGATDPRHLWPDIEAILQAVRPVWFFGENVAGHLTLGFSEVYRSLRSMGYKVEAGLFSAAECGAPHRRCRLFILAKSGRTGGGNQDGQTDGRLRQENVSQRNGQVGTIRIRATSELAYPENSDRRAGGQVQQGKAGKRRGGFGGDNKAMADTAIQRPQGYESAWPVLTERQIEQCRWPARPGQQQYEWEEPRTMADPKRQRRIQSESATRYRQKLSQDRSIRKQKDNITNKQAQSGVGRAADGASCRLDRLRLLGNGVVPQQAEKAFKELIKYF